jgi:hypothetical protein
LRRLEGTLRRISQYWRRPLVHRIECFVVDDLANWPDDALPHPQAKIALRHVGGVTEISSSSSDSSPVADIYATSVQGIAEHELVHAYCLLAFGTCGPEWYKEGMAELAFHYSTGDRAVKCPPPVAEMLRLKRATPITEIVGAGEFTQPLAARFDEMNELGRASGDARARWQTSDDDLVHKARESYHRSWALCYFLSNNPNYRERFRQLGIGYLTRTGPSFEQVFARDADKLAFEFALFLRQIEEGYRVDLCCWNWDTEFTRIGAGEIKAVRILAARGYQASGITVSAAEEYGYVAAGRWRPCRRRPHMTADGDYFGDGCLEAVIVNDYELGEPFALGTSGSFAADRTGNLYLRCRDDWHALADNEGGLEVQLQKVAEPSPP